MGPPTLELNDPQPLRFLVNVPDYFEFLLSQHKTDVSCYYYCAPFLWHAFLSLLSFSPLLWSKIQVLENFYYSLKKMDLSRVSEGIPYE